MSKFAHAAHTASLIPGTKAVCSCHLRNMIKDAAGSCLASCDIWQFFFLHQVPIEAAKTSRIPNSTHFQTDQTKTYGDNYACRLFAVLTAWCNCDSEIIKSVTESDVNAWRSRSINATQSLRWWYHIIYMCTVHKKMQVEGWRGHTHAHNTTSCNIPFRKMPGKVKS